ncbi:MAG: redox-regulated ATPase YchF [Candidatus Nealsonbacteria bacterium RBG_13_36_15]|uniref:Redox-regulated ATPase YchF n=1 Tax=Candidatus Nealsonbacteria bacterium RBG_13_36_15 TaxID=1801660 RepID=A0A1G2DVP7_9BACT|nr:MAG: redox-regulated ATPase YchF [Candidatus Nealsonbacteria bacterium RBG_13_36_15]
MSFSVAIVGLPNVGKSTLFKALTKKQVDIASYPFTTIDPNVGTVAVPDERLKKIAEVIKPKKVTPTIIDFVDIAGLIKGAHKGEGLGNQFLSCIKTCDLILEIVRDFKGKGVEHVTGEINPRQDIEIVETELLMKDLEMIGSLLQKMERDSRAGDKKVIKKKELLKTIRQGLSEGKFISAIFLSKEDKKEIKEYQFLTLKPIIYVLNTDEESEENSIKASLSKLTIDLKTEEEISELSELEIEELRLKSRLDQLILTCYNILDLITFYTTAGGKEARAWTLKKGKFVLEAASCVHSDFQEKFIRAEVIPWQNLVKIGSWPKAREKGEIKTVGKEYIVQDGDVVEFKI